MAENRCPKCGEKLSVLYFKQDCPKCGTNLLYYNLDNRLKADAEKAQKEVDSFNRFGNLIKDSTVASPVHIIRLVLFFTPLASMCLPLYYVGSETVSLISLIKGIIGGNLDFNAILQSTPYFISVLTMALVILLSLAEIISSLFSAGKKGLIRNIVFSAVNLAVFCSLGIAVKALGGSLGIGWFITLIIYLICDVLHFAVNKKINA